jgi:hypothetical protein
MLMPLRYGMKRRFRSAARVQHGSASQGSDIFAMAIAFNTPTSGQGSW